VQSSVLPPVLSSRHEEILGELRWSAMGKPDAMMIQAPRVH
jgi:hypothetical protein